MSKESEARQHKNNDIKIASTIKLDGNFVHRSIKLDECIICDRTDDNTYHDTERQDGRIIGGGYNVSLTPTTRNAAHQEIGGVSVIASETTRYTTKLHQGKPELQKNQQIRHVLKRIAKKYLHFFKCFTSSLKNTAANITLKRAQREINNQTGSSSMPVSFKQKFTECKIKHNISKKSTASCINLPRRKRCKHFGKVSTSFTATNIFLKFKFHLNKFVNGIITKPQTTNELRRNNLISKERPPVTFDYIFPCRCSTSDSLEEINDFQVDKSCEFNASSTIILTSSTSNESFNVQITRHEAQIRVRTPNVDVEPNVRTVSLYNMYRSDNVLIRHLNIDAKTNLIKTLRRVPLKRHHRRITSNMYRNNFRKNYHTYFAEINYRNQVLELSPACRQAVGIGSTWDCCIDFGRSTTRDFSEHGSMNPNFGQTGDIKSQAEHRTLQLYQCPPGSCVTGKCDPDKCFKRLKKSAPYGSHASTQARKYKLRQQRAVRESGYGRKRSKGKKHRKGREIGLASNHMSLPSRGLPPRQKVRIGSKSSYNVRVYKETPLGARSVKRVTNRDSVNRKQTKKLKAGKAGRKHKSLKTFECAPGVCIPEKCKPSDCYQRLRAEHIGTITDPSLSGSSHGSSQVGTQSRKIKGRHLRAGRETFYKEKGVLSMPQPKLQLKPSRQAVRIGSKFSFNIEFYKSMPQNRIVTNAQDQGDTSGQQNFGSEKKRNARKKYQCEPGICVPGQCNANACFQQLKSKNSQASLTGSSKGSQASTSSRKKRQELKAGNATFYRDKGVSSMPMPKMHMPNRQAVRIGSKCSFNIEFYRSMPQNGYVSNRNAQDHSGLSHKPRYQCDPGTCVSGKCNANECFQILKAKQKTSGMDSSLSGSSRVMSQGSQASTNSRKKRQALRAEKATFYKDMGSGSMPRPKLPLHMPNRQAVRIGSKCSFNIEFYRSMPYNGFLPNEHDQGDKPRFQCEPGVCIPGKCNANECFLTLKTKHRISGSSLSGSSNATSQGSQAAAMRQKNKGRAEISTFYRNKGVSSMPVPKKTLHTRNRQGVRIGSKCSFNIEFYKSMPQNGFVTRDQAAKFLPHSYNQGDVYIPGLPNTGTRKKIKPRKMYECEPGLCVPGKCNAMECLRQFRQLECKPKTCVPGKCDPIDCYKRIKSTPMSIGTDTSYTGSSIGSNPAATQSRKLKGKHLRAGKETIYKEKGISSIPRNKQTLHLPNRQVVRIGSNCSFNVEFYKAMPRKGLQMSRQNYEPVVHLPNNAHMSSSKKQVRNYQYAEQYNQGDIPVQYKPGTGRKRRPLNMFECEPGFCIPGKCNAHECLRHFECKPKVCVPGKCDPRECYRKITGSHMVTGIDGSLTDTSYASSRGSQFSTKKRKSKRQEFSGSNATFYRDRGASSMTSSKIPLHMRNRQAVRIGSTCSFNVQFYKNLPHAPGKGMPRVNQYDGQQIQDKQYPELYYYPSSSETGGDRSVGVICECGPQIVDIGKKGRTKKKKTPKEKYKPSDAAVQQEKQILGLHDQGDAIIQKKMSSSQSDQSDITKQQKKSSRVKQKASKGKTIQTKKSLQKTISKQGLKNEQGDAVTQPSPRPEKKRKTSKEKNTQKTQSPKLQDQGDTTVHRDAGTEKKEPSKEKQKRIKQAISIGRINDQGDKGFEYELGVCIPNKCDPYLCFERLRNKNEGTSTDASLTSSSKNLKASKSSSTTLSKATSVNLERGEEAERRKQAKALPVHKNKGTSSITIPKNKEDMLQPIPTPTPTQNKNIKNVVRIGSSCSFNIQFYREKPLTPSQANSIRSAAIAQGSNVQEERNGLASFLRSCCCKFRGKSIPGQPTTNAQGTNARRSQTIQGVECVPGLCNFDKCYRNDCPARMKFIDAGIGTQLRAKSTLPSYSTNAATQSRRYPLLQQVARYEKSLSSALCRCCGNIGTSRAATRLRNMPLYDYMPVGNNMGYGDSFHGYPIREQAVIIGSGCGFNVNFFKKKRK